MKAARTRLPRVPRAFVPTRAARAVPRELPPLVVLRAQRGYGKTSTVAHWLHNGELDGYDAVWLTVRPGTTATELWHELHRDLVGVGLAGTVADPGPRDIDDALGGLRHRLLIVIDGLSNVAQTELDLELVHLTQAHDLVHVVAMCRTRRLVEEVGPATVDTIVLGAAELAVDAEHTVEVAARLGLELAPAEAEELVTQLAGWPALVRAMLLEARRAADGTLVTEEDAVARYAVMLLDDPESQAWRHIVTALAVPEETDVDDVDVLLAPEDRQRGRTLLVQAAGTPGAGYPRAAQAAIRAVLRAEEPQRYHRLNLALARRRYSQGRAWEAFRHAVAASEWSLAVAVWTESWPELVRQPHAEVEVLLGTIPQDIARASAAVVVARRHILGQRVRRTAEHALRSGALRPRREVSLAGLTTAQRLVLRFDGTLAGAAADVVRATADAQDGHSDGVRLSAHVAQELPGLLSEWAASLLHDNEAVDAAYAFTIAWQEATAAGQYDTAHDAARGAALALALLGHLPEAEEWLAVEEAGVGDSDFGAAADTVTRSVVAMLRGVHDAASPHGLGQFRQLAMLVEAETAIFTGQLDLARLVLQGSSDGTATGELVGGWAETVQVDLALAEGRLARASAILTASTRPLRTARARYAFSVGAHAEVLRQTEEASELVSLFPRAGLELLLVRCCAAWHSGRHDIALDTLAAAISTSRDVGLLLPFRTVPRADVAAVAGQRTWFRAFLDRPELATGDSPFPRPQWSEELSEAELRVLRELVVDEPLVLIARRLYVSESTVKTHVRRIYRKFGVASRAAALARARELSLID